MGQHAGSENKAEARLNYGANDEYPLLDSCVLQVTVMHKLYNLFAFRVEYTEYNLRKIRKLGGNGQCQLREPFQSWKSSEEPTNSDRFTSSDGTAVKR